MNILYTSDDNFAQIAGVSIVSLFENNKDADEINVYYIDDNISEQNKQKLISLQNAYSRKITFLYAADIGKATSTAINTKGLSMISTLARLYISDMLPINIDKILYLDCDTMIRSSLTVLWNSNQGNNVVSGVRDILNPIRNEKTMLSKRDIYINAGVLLINLDLWRSVGVEDLFTKLFQLMGGDVYYSDNDQGAINTVLRSHVGLLHPTYNCFHCVLNSPRKIHRTDRTRMYEAIADPTIVHYVGCRARPWEEDSSSAFTDEWLRYKSMSPWKDEPLRPPRKEPTYKRSDKTNGITKKLFSFSKKHRIMYPLYACFILADKIKEYIEIMQIRKYLKHRHKATGIKLKDIRIDRNTHQTSENRGDRIGTVQ